MINFFWASENFPALASLLRSECGNPQIVWAILGRANSEAEMAMIDFHGDRTEHKIIMRLRNNQLVHPMEILSLAQSPSCLWPHLVGLVDRKFLTDDMSEQFVSELIRRKSEQIFRFLKDTDNLVLSASDVEKCANLFPHRLAELLDLHFKRQGRLAGNFLLTIISDSHLPVPQYACCSDVFSFLPTLVEKAEVSLGLTDARLRAYATHLAQTLEEEDIEVHKFPIIISEEEFLRRAEIITDSLDPTHPLAESFRLLKAQFADHPRIAANIAGLGPLRTNRILVGSETITSNPLSTEVLRKKWNEHISMKSPGHPPRLREGLNPVYWNPEKFPTAIVVLVHGLRGDERTWRFSGESDPTCSPDTLWPGVLFPRMFPDISVFTFGFDAPLWSVEHQERYTEISVPRRIEAISDRLKVCLETAGLDTVPCIFVCHSMGGLVVKHLLVNDRKFQQSSRGVVFFSTPHLGSPIADFARTSFLTPPFVAELSRREKNLITLNDRFVALNFPTLNFYETAATEVGPGIKTLVVSRTSAEAAGGISLSAGDRMDHINSCKLPRSATEDSDHRLRAMLAFLKGVLAN